MKKLFLLLFTISILTNCKNYEKKTVDKTDRMESIPQPYKLLKEENGKQNDLKQTTCNFSEPDTSVVGIKIEDVESTLKVLGEKTELEGDSTHIFFSRDKSQELRLTVFPGGARSQVSIFNISYSKNRKQNLRMINQNIFETEKRIKLGITKSQLIEKLGNCYIAKDSTKQTIKLYYKIENPNDSKTKILENNNMPLYYAWYKFNNDKLESFEFGFEYP